MLTSDRLLKWCKAVSQEPRNQFVSIPPIEDGKKFSMTIANGADDGAVAVAHYVFEDFVAVLYREILMQWIKTNEKVSLESFIEMFNDDGTILSSKKFRNSKSRAQLIF